MLLPLPAEKPVAVPEVTAAVQVKVVPAVALLSAIDVVPPGQRVCMAGVAIPTGMGFTVITTVAGVPEHPLATGVTV